MDQRALERFCAMSPQEADQSGEYEFDLKCIIAVVERRPKRPGLRSCPPPTRETYEQTPSGKWRKASGT